MVSGRPVSLSTASARRRASTYASHRGRRLRNAHVHDVRDGALGRRARELLHRSEVDALERLRLPWRGLRRAHEMHDDVIGTQVAVVARRVERVADDGVDASYETRLRARAAEGIDRVAAREQRGTGGAPKVSGATREKHAAIAGTHDDDNSTPAGWTRTASARAGRRSDRARTAPCCALSGPCSCARCRAGCRRPGHAEAARARTPRVT